MKVKIKKLVSRAVIPTYANATDAGMDLTAVSVFRTTNAITYNKIITYGTGLSIEIPEGYVGLLYPRSSVYKKDLTLANSVGVIDSGYRGEIMLKFNINYDRSPGFDYRHGPDLYEVGDRVGQLIIMPYPAIEFEEVNELSSKNNRNGGFGSTGK